MIAALVRLPVARLLRTPRSWLSVGAWLSLGLGVAFAARARGSAHGADHVLVGACGTVVLPLLAYAIVGAAFGARSLSASIAPLVTFGASPARAAVSAVAVAALACAVTSGALAALVAVIAHGVADPSPARDAMASGYAAALGGTAYAAWFSLGGVVGRRGGGRIAMLVADWLLDAMGGASSLVTPRAHLRNLLGGSPPMGLSERASAAALIVIAVSCALLATRRARSAVLPPL